MAENTGPDALGPGTQGRTPDTTNTNGIVGRVRDQATAQLTTQKTKATDGLGSVAQAVRQTTQHLRAEQHDTVARYAEQAADQIERLSQRLKDKDIGELVRDAQQLARRQPALFVGGAFAIGLLGARFLKSSAPDEPYRFGGGGSTGGGQSDVQGVRSAPNAYGNRVPTSAGTIGERPRAGSPGGRGRDYPSTEGL